STGITTFAFDADGNQALEEKPSGYRTTNVWDFENRLVELQLPSAGIETYAYDPDNLRVRKQTPSAITNFLWDFQNIHAELDGTGVPTRKFSYRPKTYGHLIASTEPGLVQYHFDALGS